MIMEWIRKVNQYFKDWGRI